MLTKLNRAQLCVLFLVCLVQPAAAEFPHEFEATFVVSASDQAELEWHRENMMPVFEVISGAIFGSPRDDVVLPIAEGENSALSAPLGEWAQLVEALAAPLVDRYVQLGLRVEPSSTRIARLGTFVNDATHNTVIGGYLNELGQESVLILMFANAACTIKGDVKIKDETYRHEIDIPNAGFHYLAADPAGVIKRVVPENKVLFITAH